MTIRRARLAGIAIVGALVLAACDDDDQAPAATDPPTAFSTQSATVSSTTVLATATTPPATVPPTTAQPVVALASVEDGVSYYPACGNETLDHDGLTWYPVTALQFHEVNDRFMQRVTELIETPREPSPVAGIDTFARTVPARPGDDVGTLVVWTDGVARWVSDSGNLDVWMVEDEITYNWVC